MVQEYEGRRIQLADSNMTSQQLQRKGKKNKRTPENHSDSKTIYNWNIIGVTRQANPFDKLRNGIAIFSENLTMVWWKHPTETPVLSTAAQKKLLLWQCRSRVLGS